MISVPLVSVLMSVYNDESYLREAIESILGQTFRDYEFIIINDGSTDGTSAILDNYTDPRIVRVINETNVGLIASLNRGLKIAQGAYIARMDADDISLPERLSQQVQFLDTHPDIGIVGMGMRYIDHLGRPYPSSRSHLPPTQPGIVHWRLFFGFCVAHPTVMVRRAIYEQLVGYDPVFIHAEDRDLWLRASFETRIANLAGFGLKYRIHQKSVSHNYRQIQLKSEDFAIQKALTTFLGKTVPLEIVHVLYNRRKVIKTEEVVGAGELLVRLYRAYIDSMNLSELEKKEIVTDVLGRLIKLVVRCRKIEPAFLIRMGKLFTFICLGRPWQFMVSVAKLLVRHSIRRAKWRIGRVWN